MWGLAIFAPFASFLSGASPHVHKTYAAARFVEKQREIHRKSQALANSLAGLPEALESFNAVTDS